jgi:predicted metal-dependent peptidase
VHKGTIGGGGTDFRPVFKYAEELNLDIDCLAFLTDGDGVFPDHVPRFPVIWGDISGNAKKYPWGDVVHIPVPNKVLNQI